MQIRGIVVDVSSPRTVETRYGERELVDVTITPTETTDDGADVDTNDVHGADGANDVHGADGANGADGGRGNATGRENSAGRESDDDVVTITLWGKWSQTAEHAHAGMELLVTDVEPNDYGGRRGYATTGESYVVLEPSFLVDVTDIRNWVQCPRIYYLNKLSGIPLNYPVIKGTVVHEVFGDLLRGREFDAAVDDRVREAGLELGLLDRSIDEVTADVRANADAIRGWLEQGTLTEDDSWRSEYTLVSGTFGIKGRADALRRGMPVEMKTGKNTTREPRFPDKVQATCYALLLEERGGVGEHEPMTDTGTLLYTKNAAVDRAEESGDLSPAKEFSIGPGLLQFVVRVRNEIAAMEYDEGVPTGHEADARCEYCFERDTCMVVAGRLGQESKAGTIGRELPERERSYFDRSYRAIETERRAIHREYAKLWEQTPAERADDDRALIELEPDGETPLDDGRWELRARPRAGVVSKIREGDVVLASDGDPIGGHAELARVDTIAPDAVVVTTDEPLALRRLDVYPSEFGVDRMLTALHDTLLKGDERRKSILFGDVAPTFGDESEVYVETNDAQNRAVNRALNAGDFALVHGPPGAGKTYTIAQTIRAFVERGDRVLLSAFTNRAVDNALEAVRVQLGEEIDDGSIVRVGTKRGVRADMQDLRLDPRGDPAERASTLRDAPLVAATTTSCGSRIMRTQSFDVAVVDEASQLTEPATLAAINLAERFVLVGDHHQLPPVVRSEGDLDRSLFERLIDEHPEASVLLDRQYRMAQRIQAFSSSEFYDGQLRPATAAVAGQRLDDLDGVSIDALSDHLRDPVSFVDVDGDDGRHTDDEEARAVADLVDSFLDAGVAPTDIGVIAPFRAQVTTISQQVPSAVVVDTVDRFQGSSKAVIIISFVASGDLESPIFEDYRRLNVALTRAKKAMVLVGTADALRTDPLYTRMVEWATKGSR